MRTLNRVIPLALAATLFLLLAAACDGSQKTTSNQPSSDTGSQDLVSSAPTEAFAASVDRFQQDVQSLEAALDFTITSQGTPVHASADMAYEAPDRMHLTMDFTSLLSFEMLILGEDIYVNVPTQGWVTFSIQDLLGGSGASELGLDPQAFQDLFSQHSVIDYAALIQKIGGQVEDLGDETIDGRTYRHLRGSVAFADLAGAFSDAFGVTDSLNLGDVNGPLTFDAWLDMETLLPHKLAANGQFDIEGAPVVFDATMLFTSYNETVDIPAAPADAVPFAAFLEGAQ